MSCVLRGKSLSKCGESQGILKKCKDGVNEKSAKFEQSYSLNYI